MIGGDFNVQMNSSEHSYTKRFKRLCSRLNLSLATVPGTKTHKDGNTLDFVICDCDTASLFTKCYVDYDAPIISHHFPVMYDFKTKLQFRKLSVSKPKRNYRLFKLDDFKEDLSRSLMDLESSDTFENKYICFQEKLQACLNIHAPLHTTKIVYNERPKWLDHDYVKERALRRKLERTYKRTNDRQDEIKYKLQRTKCELLVTQKRDAFHSEMIVASKGNVKNLFDSFKKLTGNPSQSAGRKLPDIDEYGSSLNLASAFNHFFMNKVKNTQKYIQSQLQLQNSSDYSPVIATNRTHVDNTTGMIQHLTNFRLVELQELKDIVYSCTVKTTRHIDPLSSNIMSKSLDVLLPHLLDLVNSSLMSGSIDGMKFSFIKPLLKKFDLDFSEFLSFRPISNISFVSKLIERVVVKQLNEHMSLNNLHTESQHGYKSGHSTETLLLKFLNDILVAVDQSRGVVVLLIDLSSAFDTVQHSTLLKILKESIYVDGKAYI